MPIIRIFLSDDEHEKLQAEATAQGVTLAGLARMRVLQEEQTLTFSPGEICRRALEAVQAGTIEKGETWCIPDLFTDEEWKMLPKGSNGICGRIFFQYIQANGQAMDIHYFGYDKKRRLASYTVGEAQTRAEDGPVFLPADALSRALNLPKGTRFSLPDLYSDEEWGRFITGAGPAGRAFATHLKKTGVTEIVLVRPSGNGRNALYERT